MTKSRPNLSRIWSRHWSCSADGQTTKDGSGAVAQDQFQNDQPGFDRLSQTHVVGNQEIGTRHLHGTDDRVELVVFDGDPAAERRLNGAWIGCRRGAPANRVQESIEAVGSVEAGGRGQVGLAVNDSSAGFHFPDDLQFLTEAIVGDAVQGHQVLIGRRASAEGNYWQCARQNVGDHKLTLPDEDELPRFGHVRNHW